MKRKRPFVVVNLTEKEERIVCFEVGDGDGICEEQQLPLPLADPQGPGPWFSFMLVNVGKKPSVKKQTEIRCHSYPCLVQRVKNLNSPEDWQILIQIGPFLSWDNAIRFSHLWSNKTRGQMPRIAKGIFLGIHFRNEGYKLICASQRKDEIMAIIEKKRKFMKKEREFHFPHILNADRVDASYISAYLKEITKLGGDIPSLAKRLKKDQTPTTNITTTII